MDLVSNIIVGKIKKEKTITIEENVTIDDMINVLCNMRPDHFNIFLNRFEENFPYLFSKKTIEIEKECILKRIKECLSSNKEKK